MFNFFNKKSKISKETSVLSKTASLLIHAAKIDQLYTDNERTIIEKTLIELGAEKDKLNEIMTIAEQNEKNSNQILDFTKDIKNMDENYKIKIIESLWKIIYSAKNSDIYESNLMRRLSGLLYLDNKLVGNIKQKIINNLNKL